jgi:hypothetical protein
MGNMQIIGSQTFLKFVKLIYHKNLIDSAQSAKFYRLSS